jgi:hypothetical protein
MTRQTNAPTGSKLKLDFRYDSKGRRMQKVVSTNNFLYDGWNLIAIRNPQSSGVQSLTWG